MQFDESFCAKISVTSGAKCMQKTTQQLARKTMIKLSQENAVEVRGRLMLGVDFRIVEAWPSCDRFAAA